LERIVNYFYRRNELIYEKCAEYFELFYIGDDFASARSLMINMEVFNRFFKKPLRKLIDQAKHYGIAVHEHCCGAMAGIIPSFIEYH